MSLPEDTSPMRDANVRLNGRILYLTEDPAFVRAQLAGEDRAWTPAQKLRDDISTDEITPAYICYYYDETLGDALRVTVIATGLTAGRARQQAPLQVVQTQQVVRNGTDGVAMPVLTQAVAMGQSATPTAAQANVGLGLGDFANANVPSVWRHGRSGSAAAKVEALSSNGMDEIEIPAFLRKQAD